MAQAVNTLLVTDRSDLSRVLNVLKPMKLRLKRFHLLQNESGFIVALTRAITDEELLAVQSVAETANRGPEVNPSMLESRVLPQKRFAKSLTSLGLRPDQVVYDVYGTIALMMLDRDHHDKKEAVGQAILDAHHSNVKTVAMKVSNIGGALRTHEVEIVAGEDTKETVLKESGVRLAIHLEKFYFSVRLAGERSRVAEAVQPGQNVLVMFAGAAPYPLIIAHHVPGCFLTAIELNSDAAEYARRNIEMNGYGDRIRFIEGDVRTVVPDLATSDVRFDQIIMPCPRIAVDFLPLALTVMRTPCRITLYVFCAVKCIDEHIDHARQMIVDAGFALESFSSRRCGSQSASVSRFAIMLNVTQRQG